MKFKILLMAMACCFSGHAVEKIILVNEGMWQTDNGRLTYFEDGEIVSNQWFRDVNGTKLGDTPNDIIQINDNLIAIALNWSNIIQFITPDGKAVAVTENIPNNRKLASDGNYLYVTSYAHETTVDGIKREFEKGYVAKIDIKTFAVTDAVEVGYEPEGIAYYNGFLFVANSGGYSFQEGHDYESTVSIIDADMMEVVRTIDTGQINLYSKISQSGQYLCINSPGDYYTVDAAIVILDCQAVLQDTPDEDCFIKLDYAATANCVNADGGFYAVGSRYSYLSGGYEFNYIVIDPVELFESDGESGVFMDFPGTVRGDIEKMGMPYSIYVNPYTGYIYATDAGEFSGAGALYQWSPEGEFLGKFKTYINPAHFLALNPDSEYAGIEAVSSYESQKRDEVYNLQGIKVDLPHRGQIYIMNGKKIIF